MILLGPGVNAAAILKNIKGSSCGYIEMV